MKHRLKTLKVFFDVVADGSKTFEARFNIDRGFQRGDELILVCLDDTGRRAIFPFRECRVLVTYVLSGEAFGIKDGFVCMSVERLPVRN